MRLKTSATMMLICTILLSVMGCQFPSKIFPHPLLVANPSEPSAEVYFFREDNIMLSGIALPVHVNEETLLQLRRATYAKVSLKPGTYQVVVGQAKGLGRAVGSNPWRSCGGPMGLETGKAYFVLLSFVDDGSEWCFAPNLITEEGARSLMVTYTAVGQ
jgi:hypothetical protein